MLNQYPCAPAGDADLNRYWTDVETRELMQLWSRFIKPGVPVNSAKLYDSVGKSMAARGYTDKDKRRCKDKMWALRRRYYKERAMYREQGEKSGWEYYDDVEIILESYNAVAPTPSYLTEYDVSPLTSKPNGCLQTDMIRALVELLTDAALSEQLSGSKLCCTALAEMLQNRGLNGATQDRVRHLLNGIGPNYLDNQPGLDEQIEAYRCNYSQLDLQHTHQNGESSGGISVSPGPEIQGVNGVNGSGVLVKMECASSPSAHSLDDHTHDSSEDPHMQPSTSNTQHMTSPPPMKIPRYSELYEEEYTAPRLHKRPVKSALGAAVEQFARIIEESDKRFFENEQSLLKMQLEHQNQFLKEMREADRERGERRDRELISMIIDKFVASKKLANDREDMERETIELLSALIASVSHNDNFCVIQRELHCSNSAFMQAHLRRIRMYRNRRKKLILMFLQEILH